MMQAPDAVKLQGKLLNDISGSQQAVYKGEAAPCTSEWCCLRQDILYAL